MFAVTLLPPLSHSIKFFMNNVSFSGLEWVEGIKNLLITPHPPSTPPPFIVFPPSPLEEVSPPLDPDPAPCEEDSTSPPPESSNSGYFHHSGTKLGTEGLGKGKREDFFYFQHSD